MLNHVSLGVRELAVSERFYDAVFLPLGYTKVWRNSEGAGYGPAGGDDRFAIKLRSAGAAVAVGAGFHLAFAAPSRQAVVDFHAVAVGQGGVCEGAPGVRPHYGASYYAAFVRDPDGHKLEAVHHGAP